MGRKKKEVLFYIGTIFSCLVAMMVVVIAALLVYDRVKNKPPEDVEAMGDVEVIMYSEQEVNAMLSEAVTEAEARIQQNVSDGILSQIEGGLSNGDSVVQTLRPLYPNDVVVVSGGRFWFVPINEQMRLNSLIQENLQILETGEMQYMQDGQVISRKGIDVSKHQGKIDWPKVAQDGVEYAFIRLGYRGYGTGEILLDEFYEANIAGAKAAGIKVGVYFFSQAINEAEAVEEAEFVLQHIAPYELDYPVAFDVEKVSDSGARMNQISVEERTTVTKAFLNRIKEAGHTPIIYGNMEMLSVLIDMSAFEEFDKWFAFYDTRLYFPYEYAIWQYSEKGKVAGIKTDVDMNISFKDW